MSTIGANPSLPGEGMLRWVKKQIDTRQKIYGKTENRTLEEINYLNNKKPWIKLASSVRVKDGKGIEKLRKADLSQYGGGRNLAKTFVLFNGVTSVQENNIIGFRSGIGFGSDTAYGIGGNEFGFKPMPGIESVSLSTKGNNGNLKEAIVKIKAYNKQQFNIIELLYLRLGYSVLLEFGNNLYVDNDGEVKNMGPTVADTAWFDNAFFEIPAETISNINSTQRLAGKYQTAGEELAAYNSYLEDNAKSKAQELRNKASESANAAVQKNIMEANKLVLQAKKTYAGNYEGMIGKITNFNWELKPDGVYDITLKILTYGDLLDSFYINTKKVFPDDGEIGEGLASSLIGKAVSFFSGLWGGEEEPDPPEIPDIDKKFLKNAKDVTDINGILYMFYDALYNSSRGGSYANRSNLGGGNPWKYYLSNINKEDPDFTKSTPADIFDIKVSGAEDDSLGLGFTDDKYISLGYYLDILNKFTIGYIEEATDDITGFIPNESSENGPIQFDNSQDTFFCNTSYYQISGDPLVCLIKNTGAPADILSKSEYRTFKKSKNGVLVGDIMNIYLQMNYLAELCYNAAKDKESKINVKQHVEQILDQVSAALGGLNRLKIKCDENTGKYYIFDENPIPGRNKIIDLVNKGANEKNAVKFLVFGYDENGGSFVRDFGIKSNITGNLATMLTLGKSETGVTTGYDATGFANWNRGLVDVIMPNFVVASKNSNTLEDYKKEYEKKVDNLSTLANKLYKNEEKVKAKYIEQTKNALRETVQAEQSLYAAKSANNGSSPTTGFIPISLNLTIDGLSGFKIFQSYTISQNFLPTGYPNAFDFIIKKYSHQVNNSKWETKLESISIPKQQEEPLKEPWYKFPASKLAEKVTQAETEKNDAEFEAQSALFEARKMAQSGGLGGFGGQNILIPGGGPQFDVDLAISTAKSLQMKFFGNELSLREFLEFAQSDTTLTSSDRIAYLFATFGHEALYNSSYWESYYLCEDTPTLEGSRNPCQRALDYYRSNEGGKANYYSKPLDPNGYPYFGRGALQTTWKSNYKKYGDQIGVDLVNNPELALVPKNSYGILSGYLKDNTYRVIDTGLYDAETLRKARKTVNGGDFGLDKVNENYRNWRTVFSTVLS